MVSRLSTRLAKGAALGRRANAGRLSLIAIEFTSILPINPM